jgi:hypothetical protein
MSHWRHAEILDIVDQDTAIHWGAQLIEMNDLVLFKLDGNKLNDTNRFVEPPMG